MSPRQPASPAATVRRLERQHDRLEHAFSRDVVALSLARTDRERKALMLKVCRDHDRAHFCYIQLVAARREAFAQ